MGFVVFDVKSRLSRLKSSAKARDIPINLDVNKYQNMVDLGCFYCGISLENERGYCLDRVDSKQGYIISNVVGCCKRCNMAKSNMDLTEFVNWLKRANDHTQKIINNVEEMLHSGVNYTEEDFINEHEKLNHGKERLRVKYVP